MNSTQEDPALPDLKALLRHPWVIVLSCVVCVGGAVLYTKNASITYQSTAQVLVMQRDANPSAEETSSVTGAVDEHVAKDLLGTHMQIIRSRKILDRALEQNDLGSLPGLKAALEEDQTPIEYVLEHLVVTCGGEGQAQTAQTLTVAFKHSSPTETAQILQSIIDNYQGFVREKFQDAGQQAAALIGKTKDELAAELAQKEAAYVAFRQGTPLIWGGDESFSLREARLREIETTLSEHKVRHAQLKARAEIVDRAMAGPESGTTTDLEKLASIGETDVGRLSFLVGIERGNPVSEASRDQDSARYDQILALRLETAKQLLALRLEARKLEAQFGGDNPGLLATREAIRELENFEAEMPSLVAGDKEGEVRPAELMKAYRGLLQHDLEEMDRRYVELTAQAAAELKTLDEQVAAGLQNDTLHRDLERARAAYDTAAQRLQSLNLVKDYNALITEVISPVLAGEQVWPKALLVYALGGFVGMLLGCGAALLLDMRDRRFRGQEDIEQSLQLDVLTHIPDLAKRRNGARGADRFLVAQERPESRAAEAFRHLRTSLCFGRGALGSNVIQVTSPNRGDGTTTVVTNLAVSLAQAGKRVLILDANLRRSSVHKIFGLDPGVGLSSYLSGESNLEEVIQRASVGNVSVISSGPPAAAPSELLALPRFDELIGKLRTAYDFVLIDSPPLDLSDALVIAARADGVLLQVRTTRKGRVTALQARSRLEESRAVVLGVAVRDSGSNGAV